MASDLIFEGNVQVYLQGRNALMPISPEASPSGHITYYIGNKSTNLVLSDHRPETVAEARQILQTRYQNGFAKHFNQHAKAEIRYDEDTQRIEIDLHTVPTEPEECPVLWLGTLEDNLMPGYQVEWEIFRELGPTQTAFVALIP
jgi:hypothetical protein